MDVAEECFSEDGALCVHAVQATGMTELIPTVYMESQHPVGWPIRREFPRFVIISEISQPEVQSLSRLSPKSCLFGKKDPLWEDFQNLLTKGFIVTQIHVLCVNFVKFGRPEISKVLRYLPDKKFGLALPLSLLCGLCPKSARSSSRLYTQSAPNFIQIGSLPAEL